MANILIKPALSTEEKLSLMREDAEYDICDNEPKTYGLDGITEAMKIRSERQPPKVPKIYMANRCIFDCKYCCHRCANEKKQGYVHEPAELARLAIEEAKNNTNGIFISSAIHKSADYTGELILETLRKIRFEHEYKGYVHAKIMPGTDPILIEQTGWLADRLSINIELPHSEGYKTIAKQKNRDNILKPMTNIAQNILGHRDERDSNNRRYARSGQTTQMMVGTMGETDRIILNLAEALYKKYNLRRVYYSSFGVPAILTDALPGMNTPAWRSRRMYQADRLVELYNYSSDELLPEDNPSLEYDIDPKAAWAIRHLELFPVEVNNAPYEMLIRVPGFGITSAKRIIEARRHCIITHDIMRQMHISMKRSAFFITCNGKYIGSASLDRPTELRHNLCDTVEQLTLFDDSTEIYEQNCCV